MEEEEKNEMYFYDEICNVFNLSEDEAEDMYNEFMRFN